MSRYKTTDDLLGYEVDLLNELRTYIKESFDVIDHHIDGLYITVIDHFLPAYFGDLCDFMLEHRLMSVLVETNSVYMSTYDVMREVIYDYLQDMIWQIIEDILAEEEE